MKNRQKLRKWSIFLSRFLPSAGFEPGPALCGADGIPIYHLAQLFQCDTSTLVYCTNSLTNTSIFTLVGLGIKISPIIPKMRVRSKQFNRLKFNYGKL